MTGADRSDDTIAPSGPGVTAWSADGRTFRYRGPIEATPQLGGYVTLETPAGPVIAQVLSQDVVEVGGRQLVEGSGRPVEHGTRVPAFDAAPVRPVSAEAMHRLVSGGSAGLEVGALTATAGVPALLDATGFNRHTFLCGQSGSGKTYALGVVLERLLLHTRLPLLVLDPNADHVHLGRTSPGADPSTAAAYTAATTGLQVLRSEAGSGELPLRVRLMELGISGAAALLQLDPIADRDEYNALIHLLRGEGARGFESLDDAMAAFSASGDEVLERIRKRVENLGIDRMAAWAGRSGRTLTQAWVEDRPRALIADTSGFEERRERLAVTVAVLQQLWAHRRERRPLLLVVDEAHDVCPAAPDGSLERLAVELFTRLAGEGRKYGIHLLLASQRPDKLPSNVLSQCDNLLLMRVNSFGDRDALASLFGFAPPGLVELASSFGLGETLLAGRIAPAPLLARIGSRLTPEGGADVPTDWAD